MTFDARGRALPGRPCDAAGALDFDDLLLRTVALFAEHAAVRDAYQRRFRYVLVDEYQDTNRAQYELVRHLAGPTGNLTVVGDEDQSIYSWRGADIDNILDFERTSRARGCFRLEENYRSTQAILDAASALVAHNRAPQGQDPARGQAPPASPCASTRRGDEFEEAACGGGADRRAPRARAGRPCSSA